MTTASLSFPVAGGIPLGVPGFSFEALSPATAWSAYDERKFRRPRRSVGSNFLHQWLRGVIHRIDLKSGFDSDALLSHVLAPSRDSKYQEKVEENYRVVAETLVEVAEAAKRSSRLDDAREALRRYLVAHRHGFELLREGWNDSAVFIFTSSLAGDLDSSLLVPLASALVWEEVGRTLLVDISFPSAFAELSSSASLKEFHRVKNKVEKTASIVSQNEVNLEMANQALMLAIDVWSSASVSEVLTFKPWRTPRMSQGLQGMIDDLASAERGMKETLWATYGHLEVERALTSPSAVAIRREVFQAVATDQG